jgi:hypothetical protein
MTQQNCAKDKYNFVLYIPEIIHPKFRVTDTEKVVLDFKINPAKKLLGRLANREPVANIELDALSSSVWLNMDGTRSILDIARIQSKKTGDDIDEAVRRIVQFMRYLANRGWIKFKLAEHKPNS